jgi:hypothetical protein
MMGECMSRRCNIRSGSACPIIGLAMQRVYLPHLVPHCA